MPSHPLILHTHPEAVVAYRDGVAITARTFLEDVATLQSQLPAAGHVLNACVDRYRFSVTLMAVALAGKANLLPSSLSPHMVAELQRFASDAVCVTDDAKSRVELPTLVYPEMPAPQLLRPNSASWHVPRLDTTRLIAIVFTSGSTGIPVAHRKTWGSLVKSIKSSLERLKIESGCTTFIGTVPAQHMYGFESTILSALQSGGAFETGRPFYAADIADIIGKTPRPRVLVSTPTHLRALVASSQDLPSVNLILSATAPLSPDLARQTEQRLASALVEIYGSTETGQLATRRTVETDRWQLLGGCRVELRNGVAWAYAGHIEEPTAMGDVLELAEQGRFILHGRNADLVNIAGRRTSIGYLNHQLNAIEGVDDGVFYMPDGERADIVTRLAALVVAPTLDRAAVLGALRNRIDAVFLPRPLIFVSALPRNETGKLSRQALQALVENAGELRTPVSMGVPENSIAADAPYARDTFCFEPSHPAFTGHFPGAPVVPGVMLLDESICRICAALNTAPQQCELVSAKFLSPLAPAQSVQLSHHVADDGMIDFALHAGKTLVARGRLRLAVFPSPT